MKLYEFVYTDNLNLSKSRLLRRIQTFLETEAATQDWAPGYTFKQGRPSESVDSTIKYFYEVIGRYSDSEDVEAPGQCSTDHIAPIDPAAASNVDY
jgi:hypothetical protein